MREWKRDLASKGAVRGYVPIYHSGHVNFCPGCGRTHWHVGRHTAECAYCHAAMALAPADPDEQRLARPGWRALFPALLAAG